MIVRIGNARLPSKLAGCMLRIGVECTACDGMRARPSDNQREDWQMQRLTSAIWSSDVEELVSVEDDRLLAVTASFSDDFAFPWFPILGININIRLFKLGCLGWRSVGKVVIRPPTRLTKGVDQELQLLSKVRGKTIARLQANIEVRPLRSRSKAVNRDWNHFIPRWLGDSAEDEGKEPVAEPPSRATPSTTSPPSATTPSASSTPPQLPAALSHVSIASAAPAITTAASTPAVFVPAPRCTSREPFSAAVVQGCAATAGAVVVRPVVMTMAM